MALTTVLGGARSGKSALAVRMASGVDGPVTFIATAQPRDDEMAKRIVRHRAQRPPSWTTVEEPVDLESAMRTDGFVIVDCLTLWVSNLLEGGAGDDDILERADRAAALAAGRTEQVVAVSNEVGLGIVPAVDVARRFRDLLGTVNAIWCARSQRALFMVAGRALELKEIG